MTRMRFFIVGKKRFGGVRGGLKRNHPADPRRRSRPGDLYTGESDTWGKLLGVASPDNTDVVSMTVYQMDYLKGRMAALEKSYSDPVVKGHFKYLEGMIDKALEDGFNSAIDESSSGVVISF